MCVLISTALTHPLYVHMFILSIGAFIDFHYVYACVCVCVCVCRYANQVLKDGRGGKTLRNARELLTLMKKVDRFSIMDFVLHHRYPLHTVYTVCIDIYTLCVYAHIMIRMLVYIYTCMRNA
jgi:hypothetical protein